MKDDGGFDHNRQSLRIVDLLEDHFPDWSSLNLTAETREGILKHGCHWSHPVELPRLYPQRTPEAQVADCADAVASLHHDPDHAIAALCRDVGKACETPSVAAPKGPRCASKCEFATGSSVVFWFFARSKTPHHIVFFTFTS